MTKEKIGIVNFIIGIIIVVILFVCIECINVRLTRGKLIVSYEVESLKNDDENMNVKIYSGGKIEIYKGNSIKPLTTKKVSNEDINKLESYISELDENLENNVTNYNDYNIKFAYKCYDESGNEIILMDNDNINTSKEVNTIIELVNRDISYIKDE